MMTHNEIKYLKSLSFKKYRNQHKKFFIEGKRIVDELIQSNYKIDKIIVTQDFIDKHSEHILFSSNLDYQIISEPCGPNPAVPFPVLIECPQNVFAKYILKMCLQIE